MDYVKENVDHNATPIRNLLSECLNLVLLYWLLFNKIISGRITLCDADRLQNACNISVSYLCKSGLLRLTT